MMTNSSIKDYLQFPLALDLTCITSCSDVDREEGKPDSFRVNTFSLGTNVPLHHLCEIQQRASAQRTSRLVLQDFYIAVLWTNLFSISLLSPWFVFNH